MIEKFIILTRGGVVLFEWVNYGCELSNSIVDKLIDQVIIEVLENNPFKSTSFFK